MASLARRSARRKSSATEIQRILALDVGGTGLKASIVSPAGKFLTGRERIKQLFGSSHFLILPSRAEACAMVLAEACAGLLKAFFARLRARGKGGEAAIKEPEASEPEVP